MTYSLREPAGVTSTVQFIDLWVILTVECAIHKSVVRQLHECQARQKGAAKRTYATPGSLREKKLRKLVGVKGEFSVY